MKHTPGPWNSTFTLKNERGVRAKGGFICFLPKPSHYSNQDQRYEDELVECRDNAKLISLAPEMLAVLESFDALIQGDMKIDTDKQYDAYWNMKQLLKKIRE